MDMLFARLNTITIFAWGDAELSCPGPRRFEDPILLPDRRKLRMLAEAVAWLAKEIPKSEHKIGEGPSRGRQSC
jgi:hypothetical protein